MCLNESWFADGANVDSIYNHESQGEIHIKKFKGI